MRGLKSILLQYYLKKIVYRKLIECKDGAKLSKDCVFEGGNYIGFRSNVIHSQLGYASYVSNDCNFQNSKIGRYCSIGYNSSVIIGEHPSSVFVSTHPAFFSKQNRFGPKLVEENLYNEIRTVDDNGSVLSIGNDVWIGSYVRVMSGLKIGDGAIIAAGAVVVKDVPPYAIVGGVPAKIIKYRFKPEEIDMLMSFKWWDKDLNWIKENISAFADIQRMKELNSKEGV